LAESPSLTGTNAPARRAMQRRLPERSTVRTIGLTPALSVVIAGGALFRFVQYLHNRSLRVDEAMLALNLMKRPPSSLVDALDYNQAAPFGFLYAERAAIWLAGASPYALRALPLLAALIALPAFVLVARRMLDDAPLLFATAWFATADGLIFYGSDVKQYSGDVAVGLLLVLAALSLTQRASWRLALIVGLGGAGLVWLSHPSVFVIGGIAGSFLLETFLRRRLPRGPVAFALAAWLLSASLMALTLPDRLIAVRGSPATTQGGAFPGRSHALSSDSDWLKHLGGQTASGLGLPTDRPWAFLTIAAAAVVAVGFVLLARTAPVLTCLLALPLVLAVAASWFHYYPLNERTLLFALPSVIVFAGACISLVASSGPRWAAFLLAGIVLVAPAVHAFRTLVHPDQREEVAPAIRYVVAHWRQSDVLYVHYGASYALAYYGSCRCGGTGTWPASWRFSYAKIGPGQFPRPIEPLTRQLRVGTFADDDWARYLLQIGRAGGRRVWILTTGARDPTEGAFVNARIRSYAACLGHVANVFTAKGARAFLLVRDPSRSPSRCLESG
jgi:hypothetical protein